MRSSSFLRSLRLAALCATVAVACAKASQPSSSPAPAQTESPRLLTRGSYPDLVVTEASAAGRPSLRMGVEVMVDTLGRADIRTLKLTGVVDMQNRTAMERWLESVAFRPAMRNGQAVRGLFRMSLTVRVERRP